VQVDHLVYATPDLDLGVEHIERLLGIRATPGGQHPGAGTRNALIRLGRGAYLEIVGPDREQPKPARPRWFRIDELDEPWLVTWAAKSSDIAVTRNTAAESGIRLGDVIAGSRTRADGVLLKWLYTDPRTSVADGVIPFFIAWGTTPHPAENAAQGAMLQGLRAQHPDADLVRRIAAQLGLDLQIDRADTPALIATISCARGSVELR
jgi:hypothetical protein